MRSILIASLSVGVAMFLVGLFTLAGCTTAQKQKADAVIVSATAAVINNSQAVQADVSLGIGTLLAKIGEQHPQPAKDSAVALALWAQSCQQILSGEWDVAGDAFGALAAGLGSKMPKEADAIATLALSCLGRAGTIQTNVPLAPDQRKALGIILSGIQAGAQKYTLAAQ